MPLLLLGLVALFTTAIVETFYGAIFLWHWFSGTATTTHDWSTSIFVSVLLTGVVLLAGRLGVLLIAAERPAAEDQQARPEQAPGSSARLA